MNRESIMAYRVSSGHRGETGDFVSFRDESRGRQLLVTDGYEFMEAGRQNGGWRLMSSWGNDGWDLGDWPLVVFMSKVSGNKWQLVTHVEGDLDFFEFDDEATFNDAVTYLFVWYAHHNGQSFAKDWLPEDDSTWPASLHGPYRWMEKAG